MAVGATPPNADAKYILANLRGDEFRGFSMVNSEFVQYKQQVFIP